MNYHYTPESHEGSKQWVKPGESVPRRSKTQRLAGEVIASVFWDAHGVIFIKYLEKRRTITGVYYVALLGYLLDEIRKKWLHLKKKRILCTLRTRQSRRHAALGTQQCSQNVEINGPHHRPYQIMASSSLHCHRLVE